MEQYRQNLLEQLRTVVINNSNNPLTDENMVKAMTVNEELKQLGYSLKPADIVMLAKSDDLAGFYREFKKLVPEVKAKPMYPDFPLQVMEMEEAVYRFHQLTHYISTYGVEELAAMFGVEYKVKKGWLPEVKETEKTEKDDTLLKARTVELLPADKQYEIPLERLLKKTEKLTKQEIEILREALRHAEILSYDYDIPFKQNMMPVFYALFETENREEAGKALRKLCQHTGDVLKCIDYCLTRTDYHFKTAQKRLLVKLIESYPAEDWKANVILSNKKARRTILVLQYLSYNRFSESKEHTEVVRQLRNGELSSWEGQAKALLSRHSEDVIDFIARRPGMLLRWTNWLIKLGYERETIEKYLLENADDLSMKTLVLAATLIGKDDEKTAAYETFENVIRFKLSHLDTELKGRKVYVDEGRLDLSHSMLMAKGDEADYVRNGLAYRIPENIRYVRAFVYWDDKKDRVDVDLHASAIDNKGHEIYIGWDGEYKDEGIIMSGDITHCNAAEYIDIDLETDIKEVQININLFAGKTDFSQIEKCFIGMMAVNKLDRKVALYDPKNCFFYNDIRTKACTLNYGYVNVGERYLCLDGTKTAVEHMEGVYLMAGHATSRLTLKKYIELLLERQQATAVDDPEDSDVILVMEKPESDNQISLIDDDFYFGE